MGNQMIQPAYLDIESTSKENNRLRSRKKRLQFKKAGTAEVNENGEFFKNDQPISERQNSYKPKRKLDTDVIQERVKSATATANTKTGCNSNFWRQSKRFKSRDKKAFTNTEMRIKRTILTHFGHCTANNQ